MAVIQLDLKPDFISEISELDPTWTQGYLSGLVGNKERSFDLVFDEGLACGREDRSRFGEEWAINQIDLLIPDA